MILSRTPHRISFFGGGTDYPVWYLERGGRVLGAAIDKYCHISVRPLPPFFEHRHRIVYSRTELVNRVDEIRHPSVRETLRWLGIERGVSVHHEGDIPARSGMGSSSAFTVGILNGLLAMLGRRASKQELALQAIRIEQERIGENVGSQDQVFAAHGGLNRIDFLANGQITVTPVILPPPRLAAFQDRLLLVFTGLSRDATAIAGEQIRNTPSRTRELADMMALVDRAFEILVSADADLDEFGRLLDESWRLKKSLSSRITTPELDAIYETGIRAGALGGKLLGAGGGGFMLFFVRPEQRRKVCLALARYLQIPFRFDFEGSRIVVYEPEAAAGEG